MSLSKLEQQDILALDIETYSDKKTIELVGIGNDKVYQVFYPKDIDKLKEFIEKNQKRIKIVVHNAQFDVRILREHGIDFNWFYDTKILAYLYNEYETKLCNFRLGELCEKYIGLTKPKYEDVATGNLFEDRDEKMLEYNKNDCYITAELFKFLWNQLDDKMKKLYERVYIPCQLGAILMCINGIKVDINKVKELKKKINEEIDKAKGEIFYYARRVFNIDSSQQLAQVLFEDLKIKPVKVTEKGKYSTDAEVLQKLKGKHPIIDHLLTYRELMQLRKTFIKGLLESVKDGKVYTDFNVVGTVGGRWTSYSPNLQNIPARDDKYSIRSVFVSEKNKVFLIADYNQLELRVLAHFSGDERLIKSFKEGRDIHGEVQKALNLTERRIAKTINFGITYGITPIGLARKLNKPESYCKELIDNFYKEFPKVLLLKEKVWQYYLTHKDEFSNYVKTLFGRKRHIIYNKSREDSIKRQAFNSIIQGSAADIVNLTIARLVEAGYGDILRLQIHDEIIFEGEEKYIEEVAEDIIKIMEHPFRNNFKLKIPLKVEYKISDKWVK